MNTAVDLVIREVRIEDADSLVDLAIHENKIHSIGARLPVQGFKEVDAKGNFASPPFIDPHTHLDKAFRQPISMLDQHACRIDGILPTL